MDLQPAKRAANKASRAVLGFVTFGIIVAAAFQIHRLWRHYLIRTVQKYSASEGEGGNTALDRSTADAPPKETPPDAGSAGDGGDKRIDGSAPEPQEAEPQGQN